ncbi:MAG: hypothetical protein KDA79_00055 [Planctomycetaceae bacterium]|nr:hypothetical protein [Planctomycetaceae bacterium]
MLRNSFDRSALPTAMLRNLCAAGVALGCLLLPGTASAADDAAAKKTEAAKPAEESAELTPEQLAFQKKMVNVALVGTFSVDGREGQPPKPERYEIEKVTHQQGDYWTFFARISYGKNDITVPVTVKLLWSGDTPMVSLIDLTIPGLGTFTSRVLFHEDRYAGTWQHGKVGGHMWGRIEPITTGPKTEKPAPNP